MIVEAVGVLADGPWILVLRYENFKIKSDEVKRRLFEEKWRHSNISVEKQFLI